MIFFNLNVEEEAFEFPIKESLWVLKIKLHILIYSILVHCIVDVMGLQSLPCHVDMMPYFSTYGLLS